MTNPLVPESTWHAVGQGFRQAIGEQRILCGYCVHDDATAAPPATIIVYDGFSVCLAHLDTLKKFLDGRNS